MRSLQKFKQNYLWALAAMSALFLVFFRGRWALHPGIHDDQCYLEWLHKFILTPYHACYSSSHLPGVAIQWIPAGWVAKTIAHFTEVPISTWLEPIIGLQTFFTWGLCLIILQKIFFKMGVSLSNSKKVALIFLLNLPALEFLTQFTFTTVAAEMLVSGSLLLSILNQKWLWAFSLALLLNATRINDPAAFLLIGGALIDLQRENPQFLSKKIKLALGVLFFSFVLIALGFTLYVGFVTGYNGVFITDLLPRLSPYRWWRGLFMGSWGLFWTAPAGILGFILCSLYFKKLSWLARAGVVWVFSEIAIIVVLNELRADYTNPPWRYIIGSLIGLIPAVVETVKLLSKSTHRSLLVGAKILAGWQVYLAFVTHSFTILNYWKVARWVDDWSLLHYVYLLRDPVDLIKLLYVAPVGFSVFSWGKNLTYFQKYQNYVKYAVEGPSLYLLTLSTICALLALTLYFANKLSRNDAEML